MYVPVWAFFVLMIAAAGCANDGPAIDPSRGQALGRQHNLPLGLIELPLGFSIDVYAAGVDGARSLAASPSGVVFVGTVEQGRVYAIVDRDRDGYGDELFVIAEGLMMPNGVAFRDGALYIAEVNHILRFDDIERRVGQPPKPVVLDVTLPNDRAHGWKFIAFGPDGKLYVPIGTPCNVCDRGDPYGTITRMNPDGSGFEIFARGVRNSVGFDWQPGTDVLWFTDSGRDEIGQSMVRHGLIPSSEAQAVTDTLPPDELNAAPRPGMHFGFPYCYGDGMRDPDFGHDRSCSDFTPPVIELSAHVAPLGMRFYRGEMFPPAYRGQIFIAEHGSWDRTQKIGYRVALVRFDRDGRPTSQEVFAQGWLQGQEAWGRPVEVLVMPDGSLLVSDDKADAIYRITYRG